MTTEDFIVMLENFGLDATVELDVLIKMLKTYEEDKAWDRAITYLKLDIV